MEEVLGLLNINSTAGVRDNDDNTVLHIACSCCNNSSQLELTKFIIKKVPASVCSMYNKAGKLPIHIILETISNNVQQAIESKHVTLLKSLVCDANSPDSDGNTVLHLACAHKHHKFALYLVKSKEAMTQVQNSKNELPLHLALKSGCTDLHLINLLITPQSICIQDSDGNTPLHIAFSGHFHYCISPKLDCRILSLISDGVYGFASIHTKPFINAFTCLSLKNKHNLTPIQILINSLKFHYAEQTLVDIMAIFGLDQAESSPLCNQLSLHGCLDEKFDEPLAQPDCFTP